MNGGIDESGIAGRPEPAAGAGGPMGAPARYSEVVLDHYRNPRNVGEIAGTAAVAQVGDPATGDVLKISLRIRGDRVVEARFKSFGCTAAIAAGSMATTLIEGKTVAEAERLTNLDVVAALGGLPDSKMGCSVLAEQAIKEAVRRSRQRAADAAGEEGR
jgi:nitrogen fixation NifU-like protein